MLKKLREFCKRHLLIMGTLGSCTALILFWLMMELIHMLPFLNRFEIGDIALACILILSFFCVYYIVHSNQNNKRARQKLEQRKLSDYERKYQYYVNLVQEVSSREEYKSISFEEDWIKSFDEFLTALAHYRRHLNDFDIASCLMYALQDKCTSEKLDAFLFDCIRSIICEPKVYDFKFVRGGELILQEKYQYDKAKLDIPAPSLSPNAIMVLIRTYLSRRVCPTSFLKLSDFLNILYLQSCCN